MKLLFEEYGYPAPLLQDIVGDEVNLLHADGGVKIPYVGYFFNPKIKDSVFILPKVFISDKILAFNRYDPKEIIDISQEYNPLNENKDNEVVFELSTWLYQAINHYYDRKQQSNIGSEIEVLSVRPRGEIGSKTYIEIILSLIDFNKKHRNLFTYISLINSSGNNKIHWAKTISKEQPLIRDGVPFYLNFSNKNKVINYDEELIALFYSVLNYLSNSYHFKIQAAPGYNLLKPATITSMIESGKGKRLLKKIRHNYYTDELVELWHLLLEFFEHSEMTASGKSFHEKLLVNKFDRVFEDMIDQLISDDRTEIPNDLREQPDGKRVDHIYKDYSLIEEDRMIYFIGDSKYYSEKNDLKGEALYKQFTYAKNVIQFNIDLFNQTNDDSVFRYRDPLTEGYNITPNFFIRGVIDFDNPKCHDKDNIKKHTSINGKDDEPYNKHFFNRLFDRDTLFLQSYDINFMFVVASYVQNANNSEVKKRLQTLFRKNFIDFIKERFEFYTLRPIHENINDAVERNFKLLIGKIYKPYDSSDVLILALDRAEDEKIQTENITLLSKIQKDFYLGDYELGTNPEESSSEYTLKYKLFRVMRTAADDSPIPDSNDSTDSIPVKYKIKKKPTVLFGIFKSQEQKDWILKNKKYNVRLGDRKGAVKKIEQVLDAEYLVLYDLNNHNDYSVFRLGTKHEEWDYLKMKETNYPLPDNSERNRYLIYYILEESKELGVLNVSDILKDIKEKINKDTNKNLAEGAPIYIYKNELTDHV